MRMIFTTLTLINAWIRLFTYNTVNVFNRILNVLFLKNYLRVLQFPQSIYQHAKYVSVVWFIHGKVEKASWTAKLALTDSGTFVLVVFGEETWFTNSFSFWNVTVFVIPDVALCAEWEWVVEFMEIAETSSTGGFQNPPGLFAAFFELSFPYILIKIFFFINRLWICSSGNIFNIVEFFEVVEVVNILIL